MKEKLHLLRRNPGLLAAPIAGCICGILLLGLPAGGVTPATAPAAILGVVAASLLCFVLSLLLAKPSSDGVRPPSHPDSTPSAARPDTRDPFADGTFSPGASSAPEWFLEGMEEGDEEPDVLLERRNIVLNCPTVTPEQAILDCGQLLVNGGYVDEAYINGMLAREKEFPMAIGNHVAIPHGINAVRRYIHRSGIVVMTYSEGIPWDGDVVKLVIGIAAQADEHLDILGRIVSVASTDEDTDRLVAAADPEDIYAKFNAIP